MVDETTTQTAADQPATTPELADEQDPSPRRRARRTATKSTRVSQQLAEARQRQADQEEEARRAQALREEAARQAQARRKQQLEQGMRDYFSAADDIATTAKLYEARIARYGRVIEQLRDDQAAATVDGEKKQALATLAMHEAGKTAKQVGELLGLSAKAAGRLIADGRSAVERQVLDQVDAAAGGASGQTGSTAGNDEAGDAIARREPPPEVNEHSGADRRGEPGPVRGSPGSNAPAEGSWPGVDQPAEQAAAENRHTAVA